MRKFRRKWRKWLIFYGMMMVVAISVTVLGYFFPSRDTPRTDPPFIIMAVCAFVFAAFTIYYSIQSSKLRARIKMLERESKPRN